ncbi:MAG TPA: bifunctional [glutamate--ammonia ligase]-adenylyl-L-tyrosine phosphorylase/[glutamate--ammonia-ligase] adenylyltransferase [Gammaproteobacteria bacterium]|nr:bifunctional [glutamate--ammonia ligase]-adenylyl-L-tyrosine phosphorylase/[glutamate--ammonia-ligase] adenylyltransferase [Gammaproteobacteria bacterium]
MFSNMETTGTIPELLRPIWGRYQQSLTGLPELSTAAAASLPRVWLCSEFVAQNCIRHPQLLADLIESGDLQSTQSPAPRVSAALQTVQDETELSRSLRQVRRREMTRIAWRDLAGWANLDETLRDVSALADSCVDGALALLSRWHAQRHGSTRNTKGEAQSLVVLGMGKLGAHELNFSSDIDVIFAYPENGSSDGPKPMDNEEYFVRLVQKLVRLMDEVTPEGFVFRVDLRLRPFGESGPLAMSFGALETYYQNHGREWERYALIKARPVAGDINQGERLLRTLRPFMYRRYLDFNVFESLREMKQLIMQDVLRRGLEDNIKLGRGGIREIEFIGQLFQLIRGGRETLMRERAIIPVLRHLGRMNYLQPAEAETLIAAYAFLRCTENRLQEHRDEQTHELPTDEVGRMRLAWSMGFETWPAFNQALDGHRLQVQQIFEAVFAAPHTLRGQQPESVFASVWRSAQADTSTEALLLGAGFTQPAEILQTLKQLRAGPLLRALGERARRRLDALMPRLFEVASTKTDPYATFKRLLHVVEAIAKRSTYLALLVENPTALEHLARLAAGSAWLTELVVRTPLLLDELMDPRMFSEFPSQESLQTELDRILNDIAEDDLEAQMDALRQFQQTAVVRVAAADLSGNVPLMKVSDFLTWIAEQVIRKALAIAWQHLQARHGEPWCQDANGERRAHFGIIAYGKLAGLELGYGSDLDLVFLHDSAGEQQQTRGARALDNNEFFTRLVQRVINILSIPTTSGVLYQVDTRLRPSGAAGLIVSSMESFDHYQRQQAWTWEHQALLRARPVAGEAEVGEAFEKLRREVLSRPRNDDALRREVAQMRVRMLKEHVHTQAEFDIKLDIGGLTDIEFLVQYWVLKNAAQYPQLLDWTDNIRNLEGLVSTGILSAEQGGFLAESYRVFRKIVHRRSLEGQPARIPEAEAEPLRGQVRALWAATIGSAAAGDPD